MHHQRTHTAASYKIYYHEHAGIEKTCLQFFFKVRINTLSRIKYISLDTFRSSVHNIDNKLQAWLTFFSSDEPADILKLINAYPEFCELYQEIAEFRTKPDELIYMYSEALAIADRNTIRLMIDDMQQELADLAEQVKIKKAELAVKENELTVKENELAVTKNEISSRNDEIAAKDSEIAAKDDEIARLRAENERLKLSRQ